MKNVFVTGGAGLVGGHLVEEILTRQPSANVIVLALLRDPRSYFVTQGLEHRVTVYYGDIRDEKLVRDIVYNEEIDTIFHLAAQPLVTVALENPRQTWETNLLGTLNVLEASRGNARIRSVIVASSDKAYGKARFLPYTEDHPLHGLHPYDASKSAADLMAQTYATCYGVPVVVARFGNIFGPGDLNFNRLVPGAMMALASGRELEVRSNGQLTRDWVYVKDVAHGYLLMDEQIEKAGGHAFNLTSGIHASVEQLLRDIGRIVGRPVPYKILDNAKFEIPEQTLSDEKIRQMLGWKSTHTLDEAIANTWQWYQRHFSRDAINEYVVS